MSDQSNILHLEDVQPDGTVIIFEQLWRGTGAPDDPLILVETTSNGQPYEPTGEWSALWADHLYWHPPEEQP